jgi:hypothetical protein
MGGFGLSIRTEDIARFGQLYLQKGQWHGREVLPAEWVDAATARQVSNGSNPDSDWEQGYGYQFWRCRHDVYRGDGAFGQYCVVMPEHDAVIAITSGVGDMQAVLNLVWEHLLGGMQSGALPADEQGHERLEKKLADLELAPQAGRSTSPLGKDVSGRLYQLPDHEGPIEAVGLEVGEETVFVTLIGGQQRRLTCGDGEWRRGGHLLYSDWLTDNAEEPVAVSGAWTSDTTYAVKACLYETPFCATFGLEFAGDILLFDQEMNVAFGETKRRQLIGRLPQ